MFGLQSWTKADDISEFEIEGISIGDSVLTFYSKNELKKFYEINYPKSDTYAGYEIPAQLSKIKFNNYISITLHWLRNDNKMKIVSISGINLYPNNLNKCLNERDKISQDIKSILKNPIFDDYEGGYGSGNDNKSYTIEYIVNNGSIKIWCTDWDKNTEKENDWQDDLNIAIASKEFFNWLNNEAY
tara:strand:+ start:89 stop:646 length:558 start_codon:yes stop_codon:yes gene_type:complete